MFFWIALPVVLVVFVCAVTWGVRGYGGRVHEPGTRHLFPEDTAGRSPRRSAGRSAGDDARSTTDERG
jgi:hypothetical protein